MSAQSAVPQRLTFSGLTRFALMLLLTLAGGCGGEKLPALAPGASVLVVGDSISAGYGLDPAQAWPVLLAQSSGWRVVNGGVSGDLSADALERLPELLEAHRPQLLLLEIGGNDMLRGTPDAPIVANLREMIGAARAQGAQVVVLAVPRPSLLGAALSSLAPADFYRSLSREEKLPLIEDALSAVLSRQEWKLDPLHPNAAGQAALARKVAEELREVGLLR